MIKDINFNGYTTQPSDYHCPDGDLALSLNLISEDGALRPVSPGSIVHSYTSGISPVFIHTAPSSRRFIIFFKPADRSLYAADASSTLDVDVPETPFHTLPSGVQLVSFSSIGNTLCILTSNGILYAVIKDNSYTVLGSHLPEIHLNTLLSGHNLYGDGNVLDFPDSQDFSVTYAEFTAENRKYASERIIGWTNKFIANAHENSYFVQPFFIRFALRLYDGSLAMHTPPALIWPVSGQNPTVNFNITNKRAFVSGIVANLCLSISDKSFPDSLAPWKDIVRSIDIFVSEPIYTYDQNGQVSRSIDDFSKLQDTYACVRADSQTTNTSLVSLASNRIPLNDFLQYPSPTAIIALPHHDLKDFTDRVRDCSRFYLIHSIPLEKVKDIGKQGTYTPLDIPKGTLTSLLSRELMTDDFNSHDLIVPQLAFNYNSRLNIADITRNTPAVVDTPAAYHTVDFASAVADGSIPWPHVTPYVFFSVDGHTSVVKGRTFCLPEAAPLSYIYHPDREAVRIVLVRHKTTTDSPQWLSFDLRPHDFLNGAAYISPSLFSKTVPSWSSDPLPSELSGDLSSLPSSAIRRQPSRIYTSSVNTPFFFPVTGMNAVGTGRILGISSAAKALSQGQFGEFPLYAFCSDGVWALSVSSTGAFSAVQPITRDVLLSGTKPLQMDSDVLFATDRGLMLISGSQTRCISHLIDSPASFNLSDNLPGIYYLHSLVGHQADTCLPTAPFLSFISSCQMIYDYVSQRVIVFNPSFSYAYVFSLKSGQWGMMFSPFSKSVDAYPLALAVTSSGDLVNLSVPPSSLPSVKGLAVTRPLKLDAPDVLKTVDTVIQRGIFDKTHVKSGLYGSRDLSVWSLIWSSKDCYLRGFGGTPYKYFRIALVTDLAPSESISGTSVQFRPRETNRPR